MGSGAGGPLERERRRLDVGSPAVPCRDDDVDYDAELGRRLVRRIRDASVGRLLLSSAPLRRTIKRVLGL